MFDRKMMGLNRQGKKRVTEIESPTEGFSINGDKWDREAKWTCFLERVKQF